MAVLSYNHFVTLHSTAADPADEPATKPKFVRTLSNTSATEGQRLVLETEVSAEPDPLVSWLKDGRELKSSESMKVVR